MKNIKKILMMVAIFTFICSSFVMQDKALAGGVPQLYANYSMNSFSDNDWSSGYSAVYDSFNIGSGAYFHGTFHADNENASVSFYVSDDGVNWSYWTGAVNANGAINPFYNGYSRYFKISVQPYYAGSLSGSIYFQTYNMVADQQTAQSAANNASAANTAAQAAQTAAQNAQNGTNTIINSYLSTSAGIVQDSSGNTALSVAKQASQNALNANTNATAAATTLGTSAGVVQDSSGTILQSARQADADIKTAQTAITNQITNIQNFMAPPLNKISGYLNTTVTSGSSINLTLDYSQANEYQYRIDNGSWSSWTSLASHDANGYLTVPGLTSGFHTIYIQIRYNNGTVVSPVAKGSITVQKI